MVLPIKFENKLTYTSTLRKVLIEKLPILNTHACPKFQRAKMYLNLSKLENFDSSRVLAAIFALKLLSGGKPYVIRFRLLQTFHTKSYDAVVVVDGNADATLNIVELVSTKILPFIAKADFTSYALKNKTEVIVNITIADLSFIRVVETHSIFFKWHDKVHIQF